MVGASLGLSARGFLLAAAAVLLGAAPGRLHLAACWGVPYLAPGGGGVALLDRRRRVAAHLAALAGAAVALVGCWNVPGLAAGALAVLLGDLVPFRPTSAGKILSAVAGRVDLAEHARAYLDRRLLARAASRTFFEGEASLLFSLLASLAWFAVLLRILFTGGARTVLELLRVAVDVSTLGLERAFALLGAASLAVAMPIAVAALLAGLARAALSVRPAHRRSAPGRKQDEAPAQQIENIPAFQQLAPEQRARLAAAAKALHFKAGERIVREGEPGDLFFAIRSGQVAVERELESGLAREVARLGPGDCFGEVALLQRAPRSATVRALTPVDVVALGREDFERVADSLGRARVTGVLRAAAALHQSPLFSQLGPERLSAMARQVAAGSPVIRRGDEGDALFLVGAGALEVLGPDGARIATIGAGDHCGEIALLRDRPRTADVRALEDATLLVLGKHDFLEAMATDLQLSADVESEAAERAGGAA